MIEALFTWKGWFIAGLCVGLAIPLIMSLFIIPAIGWPSRRERELEKDIDEWVDYATQLEEDIEDNLEALRAKDGCIPDKPNTPDS